MPNSDSVPCYYTGQLRRVEQPAEFRLRSEVRELKAQKLGKFVDNGKVFLFNQRLSPKTTQLWDGPIGIGNLLPFAPLHNYGERLHYDVGPKGLRRHGLYRRRDESGIPQLLSHIIRVSHRSAPELLPAC